MTLTVTALYHHCCLLLVVGRSFSLLCSSLAKMLLLFVYRYHDSPEHVIGWGMMVMTGLVMPAGERGVATFILPRRGQPFRDSLIIVVVSPQDVLERTQNVQQPPYSEAKHQRRYDVQGPRQIWLRSSTHNEYQV